MKSMLVVVCLLELATSCASDREVDTVRQADAVRGNVTVLENVTVIDGTGAAARPGMTVILEAGRIAAIEPAAATRMPPGARVIDGTGKFLIPGLFDMHTHLSFYGDEALTMMVRSGVLSVRDLGGSLEELDRWRAEIDAGERIGPRIFRAGPYLDGPKDFDEASPDGSPNSMKLRKETTITVTTPEECVAAVISLAGRGVDTIKTHNGLSKESFLVIAEECRRLRIPLAAHPPTQRMTIEEISDAGVTTIEHIEMLTESICFAELPPFGQPKNPLVALDELTDERSMDLFRRFAKNRTAYDPTLVAYRSFMQEAVDLAPTNDRYAESAAGRTRMFHRFVALVGMMKQAGVVVVTGTDCGIRPESVRWPVPTPGSDLHDEMKLFVEGGFTPMEALASASSVPARILRVADRLGTIEVGKDADLVLLDADPLDDITNTRRIAAVVVRGVVVDRDRLSALVSRAAAPK